MALMVFLGGEDVFTLFQTDFEFPQDNPAEEKIKAKLISYPWLWKIYLNTFQFFLKYQMFFSHGSMDFFFLWQHQHKQICTYYLK